MLKKKKMIMLILTFIFVCFVTACGKNKQIESNLAKDKDIESGSGKSDIQSYIENNYGIADDLIYGDYTAEMTHENGNEINGSSTTKLKDGSKGGVIFYKDISGINSSFVNEYICIYFGNNDGDSLNLKLVDLRGEKNTFTNSHQMDVAEPHMKSRCYCMIKDNYLICATMAEKNEGWYDGKLYLSYKIDDTQIVTSNSNLLYEENVIVYDLKNNFDEVMSVVREIDPKHQEETKVCTFKKGEETIVYASGFSNYTYESATILTTEQEFCNKANDELKSFGIDNFAFTRTSWKNRWYRLEIDESSIPNNMVKVDFKSVNEVDSSELVSDTIEIKVNGEKEKVPVLEDEASDEPIIYSNEETEDDNIVVPNNIPSNIDSRDLQDLRDFNIDGYWYTEDKKYVFRIHTKTGGIFAHLHYTNPLKSRGGHIQSGKVIQTSSYSIKLATMDKKDIFETELYAVNGQLKSDEITLYKVDDTIANNIIGTWIRGKDKYIFDDDGTYHFYGGNNSYWGYYFVIDETNIVLGKQSDELTVENYVIKGNELSINGGSTYKR